MSGAQSPQAIAAEAVVRRANALERLADAQTRQTLETQTALLRELVDV